jgi:hypothetical protein
MVPPVITAVQLLVLFSGDVAPPWDADELSEYFWVGVSIGAASLIVAMIALVIGCNWTFGHAKIILFRFIDSQR